MGQRANSEIAQPAGATARIPRDPSPREQGVSRGERVFEVRKRDVAKDGREADGEGVGSGKAFPAGEGRSGNGLRYAVWVGRVVMAVRWFWVALDDHAWRPWTRLDAFGQTVVSQRSGRGWYCSRPQVPASTNRPFEILCTFPLASQKKQSAMHVSILNCQPYYTAEKLRSRERCHRAGTRI